jgi:hypothetical protein
MSPKAGSDTLYVIGPVWHIVDGPGADAPRLGRVYPFKCFRWMLKRRADRRGLWRGDPPPTEPVCGDCLRFGDNPERVGAVDGAGDEDAL